MSKFSTLCKELVESAKRNQEVLSAYEYSIVDELKREGSSLMRSVVNADLAFRSRLAARLTSNSLPTTDYRNSSTFMTYRLQSAGAGRIKRALMIYHNSRMTTLRRYILAYKELPKNYYGLHAPHRLISSATSVKANIEAQNGSESISEMLNLNGVTNGLTNGAVSNDASASSKRKVKEIDNDLSFFDEVNVNRRKRRSNERPTVPVPINPSEPYFSGQPTEYSVHLTPAEIKFGNGYIDLQKRISSKFPLLDLFGTHLPPKENTVYVRASRDIKNVPTIGGVINVCQGSQLHVKRDDVIKLLTDGALKPVQE